MDKQVFLMNRYFGVIILFLLASLSVYSQNGEQVFRFLNLPTSTHVNAIGGSNVSLVDNDISLVFHNPALLGDEMNMYVNANYMSYIGDIGSGSMIFGKSINPLSSFAVGVNFIDYGDFKRMSAENIEEGSFSGKDWVLNGVYSRDLTRYLRGGVTAKLIYSSYDSYSSVGIGFDVGLSYYNLDKSFSAGIVIKNVGTQLSSFNDKRVSLPWDVQVGLTKRIKNSPLRFSLTGIYLTQWDFDRIDTANGLKKSNDNFTKTLLNHMVIGVDLLPSENVWLGVGFSPKANSDMKIIEGNKMGGWNFGGGIRIKRYSVGFSMAQYHPSATSYHFSLTMDLSRL